MKTRKRKLVAINSFLLSFISILWLSADLQAQPWSVTSQIVKEETNNSIIFPDVIRHSMSYLEAWYSIKHACNNENNGHGTQNGLMHYPSGRLVLCGRDYPAWNSEELSVPSVLYSFIPIFRNPDNGQYYRYLMTMLGQNLDGTLPWPGVFGLVGVYYSNDGINWIEYNKNPTIDDNVISSLVGDGKYYTVEMVDLIYEDGSVFAVVFAPEWPIPSNPPSTETFTWVFQMQSTGTMITWTKTGKISGKGIDVELDGYPAAGLVNVRVAKDDNYYYMSRHDTHDFFIDFTYLPCEGEIYRIPKGQQFNGTWEKLVEYGCDTVFPIDGGLKANEGTSFESDGFGQLWWYLEGKRFYAYTAGNECSVPEHRNLKAIMLRVTQ